MKSIDNSEAINIDASRKGKKYDSISINLDFSV